MVLTLGIVVQWDAEEIRDVREKPGCLIAEKDAPGAVGDAGDAREPVHLGRKRAYNSPCGLFDIPSCN